MKNGKLSGKVALVTGASSGIGEAAALALAQEGAAVGVAARRHDRLDSLVGRIAEGGGRALAVPTDVTDEAQARRMVERVQAEFGRLDILVSNAGVSLGKGPIDGADPADFRRMFELNVLGVLYGIHAALPVMKAQGGGHLVNVSSAAGRTIFYPAPVYSGTKFAESAISEALRREVCKDKIRVTVVEPGTVRTEINNQMDPAAKADFDAWMASMTPLAAEDVAAAILYAVTQPPHVSVNIITLRPTEQDV